MVLSDEKKCPRSYGINEGENARSNFEPAEPPSWQFWKRRRYVVATMAFFGFFNVYTLRVNLSIAVVAMTQNRFETLENGTKISLGPEFEWSNELQGYILSSFFYGYMATQLLGGYLSAKLGGKIIFVGGVTVTALLTVITPWLAYTHVYLLIGVRIIEGIFEGVTYPCIHAIWARWAPPLERSRLATIAFSGSYAGTVVGMPACAYLANAFGWPSIFYFWGIVALIWCALWMTIVANSPEEDKKISKRELDYILGSMENSSNKKVDIPWRQILCSAPVWAIVISHFSENWGFYTMLTQLPKYLKDIHDYDLGKSGFLSGLPYLVMAIMMQWAGQWADWFRVKGILTTTQVRKIFNCTGFVTQTIFMMGAAFWSDRIGTVFCLSLAVGLGAFAWAGFSVNHLDIAPQYASIIMGIGNTFATLPGIISPILSGYIVSKPPEIHEWQTVFYISAGIYLVGAILYGSMASGELQPWAMVPNEENNKEKLGFENKTFNSQDEDL
ncbi:sialin-like [Anthonomus grandis grandis]|uniref:sialin-like n=1 Tax=Anthonomus grandis grandis TaxID=2921223 RepID=UPI002166129C|nr:sialin-like [Anthonomus grandis grandis]XP_050307577.1 sialin-like [Anthonomus grandis grandis]